VYDLRASGSLDDPTARRKTGLLDPADAAYPGGREKAAIRENVPGFYPANEIERAGEMNGSRSNTPNYGSSSSLDQLNRTIEGLEARIQGLVSERKNPVRSRPMGNPVDEILERQRMLGSARDRVSAAMERAPRQEADYHAHGRSAWAEPARAPAPIVQDAPQGRAISDIAATLAALREDLQHGINDSLAPELGEIRNDMRSLKSAAAHATDGTEVIRDELARLGDSIARLSASSHALGADELRADLDDLRALTTGLAREASGFAREDSVRHLEKRWERAEAKFAAMDPELLREELVQLAWRIDSIKSGLGELSAAPAVRALEDKLIAVATAIESLGRSVEARSDLSGQFSSLDRRLDEITRAIAASARQASAPSDSAALHRLENRIAELVAHVDAITQPGHEAEIAQRIEALTARIEDLASDDAAAKLEDRIGQLSRLIERNFREAQLPDLSTNVADLTRKIDGLESPRTDELIQRLEMLSARLEEFDTPARAAAPAIDLSSNFAALSRKIDDLESPRSGELIQRLEMLSAKLEEFDAPAARNTAPAIDLTSNFAALSRKIDGLETPRNDELLNRLDALSAKLDELDVGGDASPAAMADLTAMARLESRLADIAARLDESAAAPAADTGAIHNLERQIAALSDLMAQSGTQPSQAGSDAFARMSAIEDYLASSDEFIVEAARQAAEAVVEAYSRTSMASQSVSPADISALAGLAEDLRALETHTRSSEERTAETFAALHQTLVQIAGRLDDLGQRPAPQPAPLREPVAMPKAAAPEFASEAPVPAPPRGAPKNSRVEVLQDEDMLADAASSDIAADAVAAVEAADKPAKPGSRSLLAGLAARLKPGKKEKSEPGRVAIDPAPALDAGEMIVADHANVLLEPGSGVPDVKKIMEKVRAGQKAGASAGKAPAGGQADVIAAARRAAQAAAQEAGAQKFVRPADKTKAPAKASKSLFSGVSESRRPILLAAAAVMLVALSYPLVAGKIGGRQKVAEAPAIETVKQPAEKAAAMAPEAKADPSATELAVTPPASQAKLDTAAKPSPDKIETGTEKLMQPAENADNATSLQKSREFSEPLDATIPASAETAVVPGEAKAADTAAESAPVAAELPKAEPETVPLAAADLPAGLQPASLVEAAKKSDPLALFEIGARFTDGRGVKIDLAAAANWYQRAADKGFAPAQYRLASFYEKGTGVERNLDKAKSMYFAAAEKGNASAMHNLAVLHATGAAGNPDFDEAAHWFERAADLNVRDSQFNLAILYARGNGVTQDLTESYKWFAIAAKQGDQDAAQKRDEIANAMSPEQLKTAKAKFDLWKPQPLDEAANAPVVPDEWLSKSNTTAAVDMKRAIRNIQAILNNNGFDAGKPDGEMGGKTIAAIKAFQKSLGQAPTGKIDDALVRELLARNKKA
jgi:localization factor PodJL